jgi:Ca2+-binding EF-hand superfamily protein
MKLKLGLLSALVMVSALPACSSSTEEPASTLDAEQATLSAALAATEDGSDAAWTSASGSEPFLIESCGFNAITAQVLARFDTDGDGDLSADERAVIAEEFGDPADRLAILMSVYDSDGSGSLEAAELAVIETDLEARCETRRQALLERFDANSDGTLDETERAAAKAALRERFAARHSERVTEFDRNGDGRLGALERRRAGQGVRERLGDRRDALAAEFDADQNGELDAEERAALAAHLRDCVRGEEPLLPPAAEEPAPDAGSGTAI